MVDKTILMIIMGRTMWGWILDKWHTLTTESSSDPCTAVTITAQRPEENVVLGDPPRTFLHASVGSSVVLALNIKCLCGPTARCFLEVVKVKHIFATVTAP
ncbi:hypothetical protein Hamer_G011636 [Homarus americanus]|uniref:Uncharacterized protein n=1 Tax=Homarus americanus TaxID=6706 RepID=A0A8J5MYA1_HOMAM|nr:hypothetical protein Hamer_G011636 [Homarus americanus]